MYTITLKLIVDIISIYRYYLNIIKLYYLVINHISQKFRITIFLFVQNHKFTILLPSLKIVQVYWKTEILAICTLVQYEMIDSKLLKSYYLSIIKSKSISLFQQDQYQRDLASCRWCPLRLVFHAHDTVMATYVTMVTREKGGL